MPLLGDNSGANYRPIDGTHIPFRASFRFVPAENGRRWTKIRDLQKIANSLELDLSNLNVNVAQSVRAIPEFGGQTARLEIEGFVASTFGDDPPQPATSLVNRFTTGNVQGESTSTITGQPGGGNLTEAQDPTGNTDNDVLGVIALFNQSATVQAYLDLEKLEYNGVNYGRRARSFPT